MTGTRPILIFGAGGLAADIVDICKRVGREDIAGFVTNQPTPATSDLGFPVHSWKAIASSGGDYDCVNGMGSPARRPWVEEAEAAGFRFIVLRDPSAVVFPSAAVGRGCVIGAGVVVAAKAEIGHHVFLNRGVLIGHHTRIGPFASVHAGARTGGYSHLGGQVEIGIGATIIDRCSIGDRCVIGAASLVTRDAGNDRLLVGSPARERSL